MENPLNLELESIQNRLDKIKDGFIKQENHRKILLALGQIKVDLTKLYWQVEHEYSMAMYAELRREGKMSVAAAEKNVEYQTANRKDRVRLMWETTNTLVGILLNRSEEHERANYERQE